MNYKLRKGQVTAASALVEAFVEFVITLHVFHHLHVLVIRCPEVERESASREVCRHFGAEVCSAANASDIGTCK